MEKRVGYPQESEICSDSTGCSPSGAPSPRHPPRCFILCTVLPADSPWSFPCPPAQKSTCLFGNCCPKYRQILPSRSSQGRDLYDKFRAPKILDCQSRSETIPAALKNLLMSVVPILCRRKSVWDWNRWIWSQLQSVCKRHPWHTSIQLPGPA